MYSDHILELFGFMPLPDGSRRCIGCKFLYVSGQSIFLHRVGCTWMRALFSVMFPFLEIDDKTENEFLFR